MKVLGRSISTRLVGAAVLAAALLTSACDSGPANPTVASSIHFVGNPTCKTDGAQSYIPAPPNTNGPPVGTAIDEMPHNHVPEGTQVTYMHDPPTSGCHYSTAASDATHQSAPIAPGVYDREIAAGYWIHNLEHGYVVVLYNCPSGCDADFQKLRDWAKSATPDSAVGYSKLVVLPWHTMSVKFACVSWDWYLGMNSLDINQVQAFYDNHKQQSPEGAATQ